MSHTVIHTYRSGATGLGGRMVAVDANRGRGELNSKKYHVSTMFQKNQPFYNKIASAYIPL